VRKLDPLALADDQPAPLVRNVRAEQGEKDAAIYFQVDPTTAGLQDRAEDDGKTILLTLMRGQARSEPHPAFVRPLVEVPETGAGADSFDLIVIDPGHGGFDHGVQAGGRSEKDVALRLAQQLQPLLERELGVRVLLARNGDETITPEGRAEIANRLRADIFLSLHCNGWYDATAHGFEVLYAVPERSPAADAAFASASRGLADFSPWQAGQGPFAARSAVLADAIQTSSNAKSTSPAAAAARRRSRSWPARRCRRCCSRSASSPIPTKRRTSKAAISRSNWPPGWRRRSASSKARGSGRFDARESR
jgi:N-acetylmuramoyl-L-alanine amidase